MINMLFTNFDSPTIFGSWAIFVIYQFVQCQKTCEASAGLDLRRNVQDLGELPEVGLKQLGSNFCPLREIRSAEIISHKVPWD